MTSSRHPSPRPRCLPYSGTRIPCPPSGLRPRALRAVTEVLCRCVTPVLLLFLLHSAAARVPAVKLPILQSPILRLLHATAHPAAIERRAQSPGGGPVPSTNLSSGSPRPSASVHHRRIRSCFSHFHVGFTGGGSGSIQPQKASAVIPIVTVAGRNLQTFRTT